MNLQGINIYNNSQISIPTAQAEEQTGGARNAEAVSKLLSETSSGDYLQGTILSVDGNSAQVLLGDNNAVINARISSQAGLNVGSSVVFSVRSSDSSGLFLSPLFTNTDNSQTIETAIREAGLTNDDRNITLVSSMMREGMSVGKDELIEMAKTLGQTEISDIPDAVTLSKLGIEPTNDNITQFNAYLNFEHQVISAVDDIIELVPGEINDMVSNGETGQAVDMTRDLMDIFTGQGSMLQQTDSAGETVAGMDIPVTQFLSGDMINELTSLLEENGIDEVFGQVLQEGGVSLEDMLIVLDSLVNEYASERPAEEEAAGSNTADTKTSSFNPDEFLKQLQGQLQKNAGTETDLSGSKTIPDSLVRLITSKSVSELLKSAANVQWKITPEQIENDKQVSNLYKRMTEQTGRILDALGSQTKSDSPIAQSVNELNHNLNFMNEMNNMLNYVQLPMRLTGSDAHGELYVYTNKKHMASEDGTVSALLHLDMDHLGPTDVYVAMNSANHVNTHFYLPDEESLDLIAMHIDELNDRLSKRGYSMTAEYTTKDAETNVMQEILEDNKSTVPISISSFDAKA